MIRKTLYMLFISLFLYTPQCFSFYDSSNTTLLAENEDLSDFTDNFEDDFEDMEEPTVFSSIDDRESPDRPYHISGYFKWSSAYNYSHKKPESFQTDWRGFSNLKSIFHIEFDSRLPLSFTLKLSGNAIYDALYEIKGKKKYTRDVLDEYEYETEIRKAYIEGKITDNFDIKIGRQIVVWGKSDNIRVTDVLNPVNMREPGLVDLEDLRLPVCMTKIDYYMGMWNLSVIATHERRFNKSPVFGSDFYPYSTKGPNENLPSHAFSDTEFAIAANAVFRGWDASFYFADYYDDTLYMKIDETFIMEMYHASIRMWGAAINIAKGNFLFKFEGAVLDGINFSDYFFIDDEEAWPKIISPDTYGKTKLLAGIDYSGFKDATIIIEFMESILHDHDDVLRNNQIGEKNFESAIRIRRTFLNERLSMTFLAMLYGRYGKGGTLIRCQSDYDITDHIVLTVGIVTFDAGDDTLFQTFKNNDRVFFNVEFSY